MKELNREELLQEFNERIEGCCESYKDVCMNNPKREKFAYTCSEAVSAILADVDIPTGVKEHRNFSPHHFSWLAGGAPDTWQIIAEFERK